MTSPSGLSRHSYSEAERRVGIDRSLWSRLHKHGERL